jgi:predicted nucleotidyltransferase
MRFARATIKLRASQLPMYENISNIYIPKCIIKLYSMVNLAMFIDRGGSRIRA